MSFRSRILIVALGLLTALSFTFAQRQLTDLLPDTTVLAVELTPQQFDPTVLRGMFAELDTAEAERVWGEYEKLLSGFMGSSPFESSSVMQEFEAFREDFVAECPALWNAIEAAVGREWSAAFGVSVSRFDPEPDLLFITRAASRSLSAQVLAGAITCFDGRRFGMEGSSPIYLFADGSEVPLLVAEAGGALVASSDPDLLRGVIRRANGSGEAALSDTLIASYANQLGPAGMKVTLNLAAVADTLAIMRGSVPPEALALFDRLGTTLRVVNGVAWAVSLDADGIVINSVSPWDAALAEANGEEALLALLSCAECELPTASFPVHAVAVEAGAFPLNALVDWVDTWFDDLVEAEVLSGDEDFSVRGAFAEATGVDLGVALLDWLDGSFQSYTTGVYDTDLANWLMGLPTVTTVRVTSEEAAWRGVRSWLEIAENVSDMASRMANPYGSASTFRGFDQAIAVQELEYQGVDYLRVRAALNLDVGVAVVNDHLVVASPVGALYQAIDGGRLGLPIIDRAARITDIAGIGNAAGANGRLVGYSVIATPAFLEGLGRVAELASSGIATGLWLGGIGAAEELPTGSEVVPPSYADALVLTDLLVDALELMTGKFGMASGTAVIDNDARWTTWRLPLNR